MPKNAVTPPSARPYVVGLDVHQKTITVAVLDPEGQLVERRTIRTCPKMPTISIGTCGSWRGRHPWSWGSRPPPPGRPVSNTSVSSGVR